MVEVFKTDVKDRDHATTLVEIIHNNFPEYRANFDLQDCDNILRVKSIKGPVKTTALINLLNEFGFTAEVLPDEIPATRQSRKHPLFGRVIFS